MSPSSRLEECEEYDVVVSGAGPAGSMTAALIAEAGRSVLVLEEHPEIGRPVQCAGIVEPRLLEMVPFRPDILAEMRGARFFCGGDKCLEFSADRPKAVVIDRAEFDKQCAAHAASRGADFRLSTLLAGARRDDDRIIVRAREQDGGAVTEVVTKILIGADGLASTTAALLGLPRPARVLSGFEIEATGLGDHPPDMVSVFYERRLTPGFFAWVIPSDRESLRYRIGVAVDSTALGERPPQGTETMSSSSPAADVGEAGAGPGTGLQGGVPGNVENARHSLMALLGLPMFRGITPLSYHAGGIPIGLPDRFADDNVMLIGDAAGMVKPTSGGGINMAVGAARLCARTAVMALENDDFSREALHPYEKAFLKEYGQELRKGLAIHRSFFYRPDHEIAKILRMLNEERLKSLIVERGDIDHPARLGLALARREPGLMKFFFGYMKSRLF